MKKHYKGPFFRHVLLAFFIAMMIGDLFTQNIFDSFFIDNSPAVHAIRNQGSEDGVEYESAMAIRGRVTDLEEKATAWGNDARRVADGSSARHHREFRLSSRSANAGAQVAKGWVLFLVV